MKTLSITFVIIFLVLIILNAWGYEWTNVPLIIFSILSPFAMHLYLLLEFNKTEE